MRLTLRTLLAYRDGVLEPKDATALEAKLRESSTARQISQRIDQSISNPRLAPIPLDAREFGFDANQISEYLDDTILAEHIPEMERRCLENNALLSEVGSCHMILSRAISQSIEIPDRLRSRIHSLPTSPASRPSRLRIHRLGKDGKTIRFDKPSTKSGVADDRSHDASASKLEQVTKPSMRSSSIEPRGAGIELNEGLGHQVPEYLLGSDRGRWKSIAMGAALLGALVAVGALAIGPIEQIREMLSLNQEPIEDNATRESKESPRPPQIDKNSAAVVDKPAAEKVNDSIAANAGGTAKSDAAVTPNATQPEIEKKPSNDLDRSASSPILSSTDGGKVDKAVENSEVLPSSEATKTNATNRTNSTTARAELQWLPETADSSAAVLFAERTNENGESTWAQSKPGSKFNPSARVVVPPFQRTELRIEPGIRCVIAGETIIRAVDHNAMTTCYVPIGRLILFPTPDAKQIVIDSSGFSLKIEFENLESICAVEIGKRWKAASNDDIASGKITVQPFVQTIGVQGKTRVTFIPASTNEPTAKASTEELDIGSVFAMRDGKTSKHELSDKLPAWLPSSVENPIDQRASKSLQQALEKSTESDVRSTLRDLVSSKLQETATLATRTLMLLDDYQGLVGNNSIFTRKGMFAHTSKWLDRLPSHLAEDGQCDQLIKAIFQGNEARAGTLLRLLIPFTNDQLEAGGDKLLVEALSSSHADEKTLAICQLDAITGNPLGYHPDRPSHDAILQWRKILSKGEIRYVHAQ
ncbi:MAG: hypothetical protein LW870_13465 [Pirellula sp.]|jgi:hypothetical protein|nr:hypothetical protein [Pirellula sp.]